MFACHKSYNCIVSIVQRIWQIGLKLDNSKEFMIHGTYFSERDTLKISRKYFMNWQNYSKPVALKNWKYFTDFFNYESECIQWNKEKRKSPTKKYTLDNNWIKESVILKNKSVSSIL